MPSPGTITEFTMTGIEDDREQHLIYSFILQIFAARGTGLQFNFPV